MKVNKVPFSADLEDLARKSLSFKERLKFFKIRDKQERFKIIKYVLYSKLELKYQDLIIKVTKLGKVKKHFSDVEQYLSIIPFKIKFFKLEPTKDNFYNVLLLIKKVEEGLK